MAHFQQTFHIIERPPEAETLGQRTSEVDTKHIVLNDNKPASVNESDSGFAAAAALQAISSGLQCGEPPLQFSEGIHIAHQQFGNRAVLQFVTQQIRLHDRDSSYIHDIARAGTQGAGENYPFQEHIQQAFGAHDLSGLRAHTGTAARTANAMLGSSAYHKGGDVAFGSTPTLATAAHEAAHYVQNVGESQLEGGVGASNDRYERQAHAVAEKVVRGKSAERLLDQAPGGAENGAPTQDSGAVQMMGRVPPLSLIILKNAIETKSPRSHMIKLLMSIRTGLLLDSAQKEPNKYTSVLTGKWATREADYASGIRSKVAKFEGTVKDEPITPWSLVRECIPRGGPGNNCGDPDSANSHPQENIIQHRVVNDVANRIRFTSKPSLVNLDPADKQRMQREGLDIFHNEQEALTRLNLLKRIISEKSATAIKARSPQQAEELDALKRQRADTLDYWGQVSGRPGAAKQVSQDQADLAGLELVILDNEKYWRGPGEPDNEEIGKEIERKKKDIGENLYFHLQGSPESYPDQLTPVHPQIDVFAQDFTGITSIPSEIAIIRGEPKILEKTEVDEPSYVGSADTTKEGSMDVAHTKELWALSYIGHRGLYEPVQDSELSEAEYGKLRQLVGMLESIASCSDSAGRVPCAEIITGLIRLLILASVRDDTTVTRLRDWLEFTDLQNQYMRGKLGNLMGFPHGGAAHLGDSIVLMSKLLMARQGPRAIERGRSDETETAAIELIGRQFTKTTSPDLIGGYITSGGTAGNDQGIGRGRQRARDRGKHPVVFGSMGAHYSYKKINMQNRILDRKQDGLAPGYESTGNSVDIGMDVQGRIQVASLVTKVFEAWSKRNIFPVILLTFGTTNAGAMDQVKEIMVELRDVGIDRNEYYVHLDGAYSLGYVFGRSSIDPASGWRFGFDSEPQAMQAEPEFQWDTVLDVVDSISISGHKVFSSVTVGNKVCSYFVYRKLHGHEDESVLPIEDKRDARVAETFHFGLSTGGAERSKQDVSDIVALSRYFKERFTELTAEGGPLEGAQWYYNNNTFVLSRVKNSEFTYKWSIPHDSAETHIVVQAHMTRELIEQFLADAVAGDIFERPGQRPQPAGSRFPRR